MAKNKVEVAVQVYEVNGNEVRGLDHPNVIVTNHWNRSGMVNIQLTEHGATVTVGADDLRRAVESAAKA